MSVTFVYVELLPLLSDLHLFGWVDKMQARTDIHLMQPFSLKV